MKTLLIGDVHGLVNQYKQLLDSHKPLRSIQLGDFGFRVHHEWHRLNVDSSRHHVLFGNHDDTTCLRMSHSMGNYDFKPAMSGLFWMRGADSIDKSVRIEGRDWWADEELSYTQMMGAIDMYEKSKPRIVLTHDCPQWVRERLFGIHDRSRTSQALQTMLDIHRPELWVFGHHHKSMEYSHSGTTFRCLSELETMWIDLERKP